MTAADIAGIESLTGWDTPALSNALDALRLRPYHSGYSDGSIHRITGAAPMAGRAVTARMVAREPGEDGILVSYLHRAIAETDGPVVVVLEDCDDPAGAGAFLGEVNGSLLAALGVRGVVTNGRVRDVGELTGNVGSSRAGGSGPGPGESRGLRAGGPGSGGGWVLAQECGDVVVADAEGAELADVVADLAVAVDLGVVEVGAEVVVPG